MFGPVSTAGPIRPNIFHRTGIAKQIVLHIGRAAKEISGVLYRLFLRAALILCLLLMCPRRTQP